MITKPPTRPIYRATPLMPWLDHYGACDEAKETAQEAGWTTLGKAWDQCTNVNWLLWGLAHEGYSDDPILRLFACRCVRETPLIDGRVVGDLLTDPRSWAAVETAERFARSQASTEELEAAWALAGKAARAAAGPAVKDAARAAVRDAAWVAVWNAAWVAVWASSRVASGGNPLATAKIIGAAARDAAWAAGDAAGETWETARADATRFQVNLLRQMIDPFHADRS